MEALPALTCLTALMSGRVEAVTSVHSPARWRASAPTAGPACPLASEARSRRPPPPVCGRPAQASRSWDPHAEHLCSPLYTPQGLGSPRVTAKGEGPKQRALSLPLPLSLLVGVQRTGHRQGRPGDLCRPSDRQAEAARPFFRQSPTPSLSQWLTP